MVLKGSRSHGSFSQTWKLSWLLSATAAGAVVLRRGPGGVQPRWCRFGSCGSAPSGCTGRARRRCQQQAGWIAAAPR